MNNQQMQQKLEQIEQEAAAIRAALNKQFPSLAEANPGDVLEDGTIVIEKYNNTALIAAPEITQVHRCTWSKEFSPVFEKLIQEGFNPSQWFIPNPKQLIKAYKVAKQHFSTRGYWSSTEASSTIACYVSFNSGTQVTSSKTGSFCVRAFSLVNF